MPKPERDDSGYFEMLPDDGSDQDVGNADEKILTAEHLSVPPQVLKRTESNSSIRSQISRGSSQFWDGQATPDEDDVQGLEKIEARALDEAQAESALEGTSSKWRSLDRQPERVITISSEITLPHGTLASERRLSECDPTPQSGVQRRRLEPLHSGIDRHSSTYSLDVRPPVIVAHSNLHQTYFDRYKLPWGVQWEIARLATSGKYQYDEIALGKLHELAKSNTVGARIVEQLLWPQQQEQRDTHRQKVYEDAFVKELNIKTPWTELDAEEELLAADPLSGLGCNSVYDDHYGGKVSFVARLKLGQEDQRKRGSKSPPRYTLELELPELGASTRFMRRWGSRRFVRVRIPEKLVYQHDNHLLSYFKNDFVIHGRVFQPFYAKDHSVFLFETNQVYIQGELKPDPSPSKVSLDHFLEWHNPMRINSKQAMCPNFQSLAKWCARMALGLSNSVPGIEIAPENIFQIDDEYSDSPDGRLAKATKCKPASKDDMSDGCGFANQVVLVYNKQKYNWEHVPSAIQFRLRGAKGLLLLHPGDNGSIEGPPRVWLRPSQTKISYAQDSSPDRAHRIIDVLRRSHLKYPARLSTEIIVNLAQNGVSYEVFEGLMKDGLQDIAASLTQWSGPFAMQNLWAAVARLGSVIRARLAREAGGSSRVLGLASRDKYEEAEEEEDEDAIKLLARSKAWWADEISGCPSTLEETVLILLDAGFEPQSCHILAAKLKEVFKKCLNSYIEKYKIDIPRSAEAWIVPDPYGVLEPGEIFLKTSESVTGQDGLQSDHILGEVLVTRHPCCVPSDVQKVRAVWKDELRKYCDVIIFSIKGERSLASMLGGGDYDGDTAHIIWEPTIVQAFRNADNKYADPPPGLEDSFEKDTTTVEAFLEKHRGNTPAMIAERQDFLLAALKDVSLVGSYSNWHDTAVYKFGYEHDEAWRLAYMFCAVLDSSKTGKTVKPAVLKQDRLKYAGRPPAWKDSLLEESQKYQSAPPQSEAPRRQGSLIQIKFIMDQLKDAARKQYSYHMAMFEKLLNDSRLKYRIDQGLTPSGGLYVDPALEAPWHSAMERARKMRTAGSVRMEEELEIIRHHVIDIRAKHRELIRQDKGKGRDQPPLSPRRESSSFTDKPIEQRQNILRELSLAFNHMPQDHVFIALSPEDVRRYRASYAYVLETEHQEKRSGGFSRFPFDVAMRELGFIKAQSIGPCNMVSSRFYSVFNVSGTIKSLRPSDGPAYTF